MNFTKYINGDVLYISAQYNQTAVHTACSFGIAAARTPPDTRFGFPA